MGAETGKAWSQQSFHSDFSTFRRSWSLGESVGKKKLMEVMLDSEMHRQPNMPEWEFCSTCTNQVTSSSVVDQLAKSEGRLAGSKIKYTALSSLYDFLADGVDSKWIDLLPFTERLLNNVMDGRVVVTGPDWTQYQAF